MDQMIYNLFLSSRSGLTLFGLLHYELRGIEASSVPEVGNDDFASGSGCGSASSSLGSVTPPPWRHLAHQQRLQNIEAAVYRVRGTLSMPLLTGIQAVAIEGLAFLLPSGQPLVTFIYGVDTPFGLVFNQANGQQIGGSLQWDPTNTAFGTLGRRVMLPA